MHTKCIQFLTVRILNTFCTVDNIHMIVDKLVYNQYMYTNSKRMNIHN